VAEARADELPIADPSGHAGGPAAESTEAGAEPAPSSGSAATEVGVNDEVEERPGVVIIARRFAVVSVLVVLDLWSKAAVFGWLRPIEFDLPIDGHGHPRHPIFGEWFSFMLSLNPGAAFGRLASMPHLLVGGRVLAAVFLSVLLFKTARGRRVFSLALILILGGALGNLYDNLFLIRPESGHPYGEVRDFIDVYFSVWDWHFPTFNVADSCISTGAVLLLISGLLGDGRQRT
jgi:signal peptidase II